MQCETSDRTTLQCGHRIRMYAIASTVQRCLDPTRKRRAIVATCAAKRSTDIERVPTLEMRRATSTIARSVVRLSPERDQRRDRHTVTICADRKHTGDAEERMRLTVRYSINSKPDPNVDRVFLFTPIFAAMPQTRTAIAPLAQSNQRQRRGSTRLFWCIRLWLNPH